MGNEKTLLERVIDEVLALIIIVTTALVSIYVTLFGKVEVLKEFFQYFIVPLAVPIIAFFFGQRTARKSAEEAKD